MHTVLPEERCYCRSRALWKPLSRRWAPLLLRLAQQVRARRSGRGGSAVARGRSAGLRGRRRALEGAAALRGPAGAGRAVKIKGVCSRWRFRASGSISSRRGSRSISPWFGLMLRRLVSIRIFLLVSGSRYLRCPVTCYKVLERCGH